MHPVRHIAPRSRLARRGFTLIELLVVIVIIAILLAFLVPAVSRAIRNAREAQVVAEISGFDKALVDFKSRYGVDVPSFIVLYEQGDDGSMSPPEPGWGLDTSSILPGTQENYRRASRAFIRQVWPDYDFSLNHDFNGDGDATDVHVLNGAECLVFFLGGVMTRGADAASFLEDTPVGFAANPQDPFDSTSTTNRVGPFAEFQNSRFTDVDVDGFPEYKDQLPGQQRPYIYCSSYGGRGYQPYGLNGTQNDADDEIPQEGGVGLINDLYRQDDKAPATTGPYLNANTHQILSPGGDDFEFGRGGEYNGENAANTNERDNITNFKGGRLN